MREVEDTKPCPFSRAHAPAETGAERAPNSVRQSINRAVARRLERATGRSIDRGFLVLDMSDVDYALNMVNAELTLSESQWGGSEARQ